MSAWEVLREKFGFTVEPFKDGDGNDKCHIVQWRKEVVPASVDGPAEVKWHWESQLPGWGHDIAMWDALLEEEQNKRRDDDSRAEPEKKSGVEVEV